MPGNKYYFSEYNRDQKIFIAKSQNSEKRDLLISCDLDFDGIKFNKNINEYEVGLYINPYLNAQNDVFTLQDYDLERIIGYIFPLNALIEDSYLEVEEQNVNNKNNIKNKEYIKAYKFYSYKFLLTEFEINNPEKLDQDKLLLSDIYDDKIIVVIIYKPLIESGNNVLKLYNPSLALHGYYNYTNNLSFYNYIQEHSVILESTIQNHYLKYRGKSNIKIKKCNDKVLADPIIDLLYNKFLPIADNSLYRFLLLYQFIEHFIDLHFRTELSKLLVEIKSLTAYEIFDELVELKKERKRINQILNNISFDDKSVIENLLKRFITNFKSDYKKNTLGDYFYDIRNLLVHNYKKILEKDAEIESLPIIILLEIVIHNLILEKKFTTT